SFPNWNVTLVSRIHGFWDWMFAMNASVMMVGLDGAGKTTILYQLKLGETIVSIPTIGFHTETLDPISGVLFLVWDVGIGCRGRPLLRHYLSGRNAILFVVDSTDSERLDEAKELLFMLLHDEASTGLPLLVLANKQDLDGAQSPADIAHYLDLDNLKGRKWTICGCCGKEGKGLLEAMEKLSTMIKEK
uniref:ADP-ribosylation factor-like protein 14 n=1 Tax=Leptobrachium leishanense TaxID=445787 RepID=A0A8C5R2Z8_9ANUR